MWNGVARLRETQQTLWKAKNIFLHSLQGGLLRGHWVCGMGGALEQSPESKCRTCRLHKTGRPIIARICSSIENNKIWWVGKQYNIHAFPNIEESENLLRENFSDANAAPPRIMLPVKSQIKLKLCKYQEENFSISCSLMEMLLSKEWHEDFYHRQVI